MCVGRWYWHIHSHHHMLQLLYFSGSVLQSAEVCAFPQIALAARVLTSSIGVRVRRFFGFVLAGAVGQGAV